MEQFKKVSEEMFDIKKENLEKLKQLFPSAVKDGQLDIKALKEELGEFEEVGKEKYEMTWAGKQQAKDIAQKAPLGKTLKFVKGDGINEDTTNNIYIEGDNLEVLKLLRKNYYGSIKMIYIDPPYNTGNDFIYNDNYGMSQEELEKQQGQRTEEGEQLQKNTKEGNAKYHTNWLNMMYPRLKLAKDLLTDDGVIFISIDDNEVSNLKKLCDEIFGENNFYGCLIQLKGNTQNDSKSIQKNHEYILIYVKIDSPLLLTYDNSVLHEVFEEKFYLGRDTGASSGHDKLLERVNLGYTIYYFEGTQSGATGNHNTLLERVNLGYKKYSDFNYFVDGDKVIHAIAIMDYDQNKITGDSTEEDVYNDETYLLDLGYVKIRPPKRKGGKLGCWTWGLNTFKELWNNNEVLIKNNKNIIKKEFVNENDIVEIKGKKYFQKINNLPIQSIVKITNSVGSTILKGNDGLMPGIDFNNPKNPELIKFFLKSYHDNNLIILDFFSGSATTAHAVMQLNAEDNGNRKFIMVQLPEQCEEKSEAYKAGYKNICEIGKERIRRAGKQIQEQNPDKKIDIGFKVFKVADTTLNWEKLSLQGKDLYSDYNENNTDKDKLDFTPGFTDLDVVYEIMLRQEGLPLTSKIETLQDIGQRTFLVADSYLICLEENITQDIVSKLSKLEITPIKFVFRDSAFNDDIALKDETFRRLSALIDKEKGESKKTYTIEFI